MIVLDTHALIWYVADPKILSTKAKKAIDLAVSKKEVLVSSISIWEICLLVNKSRLTLTIPFEQWIKQVENLPFIRFIPIDNTIAAASVALTPFHKDPADRIITATTINENAVLITADKRIAKFKKVNTLW